jgi:hypothetical protein
MVVVGDELRTGDVLCFKKSAYRKPSFRHGRGPVLVPNATAAASTKGAPSTPPVPMRACQWASDCPIVNVPTGRRSA